MSVPRAAGLCTTGAARDALHRLVSACLLASLFAAGGSLGEPGAEVVVDVDSAKREMRVLRGDKVLAVFNPVSVGRWGVSRGEASR